MELHSHPAMAKMRAALAMAKVFGLQETAQQLLEGVFMGALACDYFKECIKTYSQEGIDEGGFDSKKAITDLNFTIRIIKGLMIECVSVLILNFNFPEAELQEVREHISSL